MLTDRSHQHHTISLVLAIQTRLHTIALVHRRIAHLERRLLGLFKFLFSLMARVRELVTAKATHFIAAHRTVQVPVANAIFAQTRLARACRLVRSVQAVNRRITPFLLRHTLIGTKASDLVDWTSALLQHRRAIRNHLIGIRGVDNIRVRRYVVRRDLFLGRRRSGFTFKACLNGGCMRLFVRQICAVDGLRFHIWRWR